VRALGRIDAKIKTRSVNSSSVLVRVCVHVCVCAHVCVPLYAYLFVCACVYAGVGACRVSVHVCNRCLCFVCAVTPACSSSEIEVSHTAPT